jgi:hypothetical protein
MCEEAGNCRDEVDDIVGEDLSMGLNSAIWIGIRIGIDKNRGGVADLRRAHISIQLMGSLAEYEKPLQKTSDCIIYIEMAA